MDDWTVNRLIETGKRHHLESEIRKLLKANEIEHKRVNMRDILVSRGTDPARIERMLTTPYCGEMKATSPHKRPDTKARKDLKKRMRGRRR